MAITVGLAADAQTWKMEAAPLVFLGDDGYYWFLDAFWLELEDQASQYVDLYGAAVFDVSTLPVLRQTVLAAREHVLQQPEQAWQVQTGWLAARMPSAS